MQTKISRPTYTVSIIRAAAKQANPAADVERRKHLQANFL